jgi:tellurite resistance protein TerA
VNLNWDQTKVQPKGLLSRLTGAGGAIDLDLACLYELKNGKTGVIQALGNSFGSLTEAPYAQLDGDDRSGTSTQGETIRVNLAEMGNIKRLLFFTFIYEGVPSWSQANAVATITSPLGDRIEIRLDEHGSDQRMCALALVENGGDGIDIERLIRFFNGHQQIDRAYSWGMKWTAGRK